MKKNWIPVISPLVLAMGLTLPQQLQAIEQIIYDNSKNDRLVRFENFGNEVGDEVTFAGTERWLVRFDFEYWGLSSLPDRFTGDVQARVRFYLNDGPLFNGYATPGTMFYDSDWFGGFPPTPRSTLVFLEGTDFPVGGLFLPADTITWSVQFDGMGAGDQVGVDLYWPPEVGSSYGDYWDKRTGDWELNQDGVPLNFASRFFARSVPEGGATFFLLLLGTASLAAFKRGMISPAR